MLLARADVGEQPLHREPVDLACLVRETAESARWMMGNRAFRVEIEDAALVLGDADRLQQVMLNLLENAVKHTPGSAEIALTLASRNGSAVVTVADNGEGIPPEHLPKIFDRFYRVDGARSRERGGTGLGLAIGRWIAEAHGGTLRVASATGVGTVFTLTLPGARWEAGIDDSGA
jgi:signal transduction histidine kinase